ncbi:STAS domain-containing protein [Streptomyces sp. NPDC002886]|uniref:STAS domain-containing protein n=1 Tax=Streptomyces sp. NPDC002886 TaxID=3364667 RepID=UPI003699E631
MTEPILRIRAHALPGSTLLTVSGEIDLDTAPQLQAAVDAARHGPGRALLLDMAGVDFCDCSGLTVLMRARDRGPVQVHGARPQLLQLLTSTGTRDLLFGPVAPQALACPPARADAGPRATQPADQCPQAAEHARGIEGVPAQPVRGVRSH